MSGAGAWGHLWSTVLTVGEDLWSVLQRVRAHGAVHSGLTHHSEPWINMQR